MNDTRNMIKVSELKPHKSNGFYFDDMEGDNLEDFLQSIRTSGVTNAITIDQNNTIISGHQRVRACKMLGIKEIPYHRITYTEEEMSGEYSKQDKDLIESNLKQRVAGNSNPVKLGKCIVFLEGYYGIQNGRPEKLPQNAEVSGSRSLTQEDLASQLGISVDTLNRYKKLTEMIPEIQNLIETGIATPSVAKSIIAKLPEFQQQELARQFTKSEEKATKKAVEKAIKEMRERMDKEKAKSMADLEARIKERDEEIKKLNEKISGEKNDPDFIEEDDSNKKLTSREKFEKARADRLMKDKEKLEEELDRLKKTISESNNTGSGSADSEKEIEVLKAQTLTNARSELADFVNRYSSIIEIDDIKKILKDMLKSL